MGGGVKVGLKLRMYFLNISNMFAIVQLTIFNGEITILSSRLYNQNQTGASLFCALQFSFINKEFALLYFLVAGSTEKRHRGRRGVDAILQRSHGGGSCS